MTHLTGTTRRHSSTSKSLHRLPPRRSGWEWWGLSLQSANSCHQCWCGALHVGAHPGLAVGWCQFTLAALSGWRLRHRDKTTGCGSFAVRCCASVYLSITRCDVLSFLTLTWIWLRSTAARRIMALARLWNSLPIWRDFSNVVLRWSTSRA